MAPGVNRTDQQLQDRFHDNVAGDISAQDGRDLIASSFGFSFPRAPGATDDRNNTSGVGGFFDFGSRWFDSVAQRWWKCIIGTPSAAQWISLPLTGVIPGVYGDATHSPQITITSEGTILTAVNVPIAGGGGGVTSVSAGQGVRTGTGLPITGVGIVLGDRFITTKNVAYSLILTDRGTQFIFGPADTVVNLPASGIVPNGWYELSHCITAGTRIHFQAPGPMINGGGLAWVNEGAGGPITDFFCLGGDDFSVASDGLTHLVRGLPIYHGLQSLLFGPASFPSGVFSQLTFGATGFDLGAFGVTLGDVFRIGPTPFSNLVAPMTGIYHVRVSLSIFLPAFVGSATWGEFTLSCSGAGESTKVDLYTPGATLGPDVRKTVVLDFVRYMLKGDQLNFAGTWIKNSFGPANTPGPASPSILTFTFLGT